jgi:predicted RNA-binding protein with PIN domain
VVFSPAGTSADSVIEGLARAAVERGKDVLVVTSDAATQWTVLGSKVSRMSSAGFSDEMQRVRQEAAEAIDGQANKRTLAERIDERTRTQLERIARGG